MIAKFRSIVRLSCLVVLLAFTVQGCSDAGADSDSSCLKAAAGTYPAQATSPYVLPYSIGATYIVGQGNCTTSSHNAKINQEFAYDMIMPTGTTLVASRGGVVVAIEEGFVDGTGVPGEENYVIIEHDDGTKGRYIHLTNLGALVELQDVVVQGQSIAISGNTGNSTQPHLHFDVGVSDGLCRPRFEMGCRTVPVNFRNTSVHEDGLIQGQSYTAQ